MPLARFAGRMAKRAAIWCALATVTLSLVLAGLGFLVAGFCIWLAQHVGNAAAAAITGGSMLLLAVVVSICGSLLLRPRRRREPGLLADVSAAIAGVVVESLANRRKAKQD
jgi:hypothetical protein